jgi:hypothetical protein
LIVESMPVEMDKAMFLNIAPEYYMLALFIHFEYPQGYYTDEGLVKDFTYVSDDQEEYCYVENSALRREALRLLQKHNAVNVIDDPFGPTIWQRGEEYDRLEDALQNSPVSAFFKARVSGDRRGWLNKALESVNRTARELNVTEPDFQTPPEAEGPDEWTPITISQSEPEVSNAVMQLQAATEAIEQDNGYAVAHPQERDLVVYDIKGGLAKLKSETISIGWVRRTVGALKIASGRFANTLKGQTIDGALMALKELVKTHMSSALEHLWSLLFGP